MIGRADIEERVREWGLREDVVEKDYVIGWLLWGIGTDPVLGEKWVFKGGTSLKKCYLETYRFSEDLDFTVLPDGPVASDTVAPLVREVLQRVGDESGIDFSRREPAFKTHESGKYTQGRVYYVGPRQTPGVASIIIDLSGSEVVARPPVLREVSHAFPDTLPAPGTVLCYCFEEVFAEKIRAMGERGRPRDLYDIVNLFRRQELGAGAAEVRAVLAEKCRTKGVAVPTFAALRDSTAYAELEADWANMLAHQLPALPPLADFWSELPKLFAWLDGTQTPRVLRPVPASATEREDTSWTPPPTVRMWGVGVPLETIRFAAVNHLCVELGYGGSARTIEPYSLRQTLDGNLVLHAVRADSREHRSYRVDRIESVRVTTRTFNPVYQIEFSGSGPLRAPQTMPTPRPSSFRAPTIRRRTGVVYLLQCPYCQRQFRRSNYSDTQLNEHKDSHGSKCPGSGRRGAVVGTR